MFQIVRFFNWVAVSLKVRIKTSHAASSSRVCNGSIDAERAGTLASSRGMPIERRCCGRRTAKFWPLVGGEHVELRPVDRRPGILENAASISRVGVPRPIRIAESAGFEKVDETSLP